MDFVVEKCPMLTMDEEWKQNNKAEKVIGRLHTKVHSLVSIGPCFARRAQGKYESKMCAQSKYSVSMESAIEIVCKEGLKLDPSDLPN